MEGIVTKTELSKRWSAALINKFQPTVVLRKKNCYGGITSYYSLAEIESIENGDKFQTELGKTKKRKADAAEREKKILERKVKEFLSGLTIKLPKTKEQLLENAIKHYNSIQDEYRADKDDDKDFLLRITQNYVRHMCSNYEHILDKHFEGKYAQYAYNQLKEYLNQKVVEYMND